MSVVKADRNWIKELVEMRDEVTHFSDLEGLSCFLIMQSKETDEWVRVYYPSLPSGERVSKYMDRTWNNICHNYRFRTVGSRLPEKIVRKNK